MRRFAMVLGMTVLVAVCALALSAPQAQAGCTVGFFAECHGTAVYLNWNIGCEYPCTADVLSILRRPASSRTWTTIATNPEGDNMWDYPPPSSNGGYVYRLVLAEHCPGGNTITTWDVGPVTCP